MKKLLALLLAMAMVLSLCACTNAGSDGGEEDEQEQEAEYPIEVEFTLEEQTYTLEIQEKKDVSLTFLYTRMDAENLQMYDIYLEDVLLEYTFHADGTYKERKGVYSLDLDELTLTLKISGADRKEAKSSLLAYWEESGEKYAQDQIDLINGEAVSASSMIPVNELFLDVEIDGSKVTAVTFYEEKDVKESEYTFHSNGAIKTEAFYRDGEAYSKYTYDRKGNLTDEWHADDPTDVTGPDYPVNTDPMETYPPEPMPTEPMPTEPMPSEPEDWVFTYYPDGSIQSETHYEDGVLAFCWEYYENGTVSNYTSWYANGNICYYEHLDTNGDLLQNGANYENGYPEFVDVYTNGIVTSSAYYYENGNIETCFIYDANGQLDECFFYYEQGGLECYEDYADGLLLNGVLYDETGKVVEVYSGETVPTPSSGMIHNDSQTVIFSIDELTLGSDYNYYTADGRPVYIAVAAPLENWLAGNSLYDYVDYYGAEYFDISCWDSLLAQTNEEGYAPLTPDTYAWLVITISGNPAWEEDESFAYLYMAYLP